ncbi:Asparagine synthetase [glutamine-hydrolyzing] 3 [compost metagenome]
MCGICGIFNVSGEHPVDASVLAQMNHLLSHRGPDGEGVYIHSRIGLGHRRLSIIDIHNGQQPMCNEDEMLWVTYNGEIYNFAELKKDLLQKGHIFKTDCDTEVIIHAYEEYGEDCVHKFNGMFAFALWDQRREQLFLARDRLGVKPLYYTLADGQLIFASEIKAILAHPAVKAEVEPGAIPEYLFCTVLLDGGTMFRNIHSLAPGHTMKVEGMYYRPKPYWDIQADQEKWNDRSQKLWMDETLSLMEDSVRLRQISDVPFGALLSGGLDSSLLSAIAQSEMDDKLRTFSMEYGANRNGINSDVTFSRLMAARLGTQHTEYIFNPEDYRDILENVTWHMEKPVELTTPSLFLLYREIKKDVSVVISGEGADELFGGYYFFLKDDYSGPILQFPWAPYYQEVSGLLDPAVEQKTGFHEKVQSTIHQSLNRFKSSDSLNRVLYLFMKYYLLEMLERQDKTSMASGVEVRVPFLDYRMVECIMNLPSGYKVRDHTEKWFLKQISRPLLPVEVVDRKKKPFPFPIDPKSIVSQRELAIELLTSGNSKVSSYFDKKKTCDFLNKRGAYRGLDSLAVFRTSHALIALELWHKTFGV